LWRLVGKHMPSSSPTRAARVLIPFTFRSPPSGCLHSETMQVVLVYVTDSLRMSLTRTHVLRLSKVSRLERTRASLYCQNCGCTWSSPCWSALTLRSVQVIRYVTWQLLGLHVHYSLQPDIADRAYTGAPPATLSVFRCTLQGSTMAKNKYAALTTSSRHIPPLSLHCFGRRPERR
jgi:hypothetical protein